MLSPSAENMSSEEMEIWNKYRSQRIKELMALDQSASVEKITQLAWAEFLSLRWGNSVENIYTANNGIEYAMRTNEFGPDLNGIKSTLSKIFDDN